MKIQVTVEVPDDGNCWRCEHFRYEKSISLYRCCIFLDLLDISKATPVPACIQARKLAGEEGKG